MQVTVISDNAIDSNLQLQTHITADTPLFYDTP